MDASVKETLVPVTNNNGTHLRENSKNRNTRQEKDQGHQLQTDTDQIDTNEARQLAMGLSTHTLPKRGDHRITEEGDEERRRT